MIQDKGNRQITIEKISKEGKRNEYVITILWGATIYIFDSDMV